MALAETTVYEVVTRFLIEERGAVATQKGMRDVERSLTSSTRALATVNLGLGTMLRFWGPLAGVGAVIAAMRAGFSNLNDEMKNTIGLAAQFNTAFQFDKDPSKNFLASMRVARGEAEKIFQEGLRLPATTSELMGAVASLSGVVLNTGGDRDMLRRIAGNLTVVGPMARQNVPDAANQVFRMITGQASAGDNPLYAFLRTVPGFGKDTGVFNQMAPMDRLRKIDQTTQQLATKDMIDELSRTWGVQSSTFIDQLFGSHGAFGIAFAGDHESFITALADLNESIRDNMPSIVGAFRALADLFYELPKAAVAWMGADVAEGAAKYGQQSLARKSAASLMQEYSSLSLSDDSAEVYRFLEPLYAKAMRGQDGMSVSTIGSAIEAVNKDNEIARGFGQQLTGRNVVQQLEAEIAAQKKATEDAEKVKAAAAMASPNVTQNFNIKLDLRTDESPEGVVVRMRREIEREMRAPLSSPRAVPLGPGPSGIR